MSDLTSLLAAIERGDFDAAEASLPLVYEELRKPAAHRPAPDDAKIRDAVRTRPEGQCHR
jgi:hypothetical protein